MRLVFIPTSGGSNFVTVSSVMITRTTNNGSRPRSPSFVALFNYSFRSSGSN